MLLWGCSEGFFTEGQRLRSIDSTLLERFRASGQLKYVIRRVRLRDSGFGGENYVGQDN